MPYFMQVGEIPRKRFSRFEKADGSLYAAEVMGEEGFSSDMSLLYHKEAPTGVLSYEQANFKAPELYDNTPLIPRLFNTSNLVETGNTLTARTALCGNDDVMVSFVNADTASPLYRNAMADELYFVHDGEATVETVFGTLAVEKGDYVVLPKGTTHRFVPNSTLRALVFEVAGHVRPPNHYLTQYGQYLQMAPYSELDLKRPTGPLLREGENVEVMVRTREGMTRYVYQTHPFDVVGWFGCNYPYVFNVRDYSPITGSFHRPPPAHQVFEANNLVICNFVPRMLDYDPRAMPIPSFHSNVDSDEVIFYAEGNFFSRKGGIARGGLSLHPSGHTHGPHPSVLKNAGAKVGQRSEECAIMLDTFRPLRIARESAKIEVPDYVMSWTRP